MSIAAIDAPAVDPLVLALVEKLGPREAAELYETLDPDAAAGIARASSRGPNQSIRAHVADLRHRVRLSLSTSARRKTAVALARGTPVPMSEIDEREVARDVLRLYALGAGTGAVAEFTTAARAALAAAESEQSSCKNQITSLVDQIARAHHPGEAFARHYPKLHDLVARLAQATRRREAWPAVVDQAEAVLPSQIARAARQAVGATGYSDAYRLSEVLTNWSATPEAARNRQVDPVARALATEASNIEPAVTQLAAAVPSAGAVLLDSLRRALTVSLNERVAAHHATTADPRAVAERLLAGDVATWQRVVTELPADQPRSTDSPPVAVAKALRTVLE